MSQFLQTKIDAVRRKQAGVSAASGLAALLGALVLLLAAEMMLDYWVAPNGFPRAVRAAFLAVDLAVVIWFVLKYMISPIVFGPDDDEIALLVESNEPAFAHRLIASVQLVRPDAVPVGASASLVRAMVAQTEGLARGIDFARVVKTDRLLRLITLTTVILVLGLGGFMYAKEDGVSTDLLQRAFLSNIPVPRKTRVEVLTGDFKVARGDNVTLRARARGAKPPTGTLYVTTQSGREQEFALDPAEDDNALFSRTLDNVQESFDYWVKLNDGSSDSYHGAVLIRPAVTKLEVEQIFPAYTRMGTVPRNLGDLSILNGSKLKLKVTANHKVRVARSPAGIANVVHVLGADAPASRPANPGRAPAAEAAVARTVLKDVELKADVKNPTELTAEVDLPARTGGFSINLIDEDDLQSKDPVVYRVDLVGDKEPTIRITYPERKEELATRMARLTLGFDAADDYGLSKLVLKYKVDDGPESSIPVPLAGSTSAPASSKPLRSYRQPAFQWSLSSVQASPTSTKPSLEGSTVEYWLEAEDNNNVTGPGRGASEHFSARVVTEAEKRAEMLARLGQSIEDVRGVSEDQEKLNQRLGNVILDRPEEKPKD